MTNSDTCCKCNVPISNGGNWGFCDLCADTEVTPVFEKKQAHDYIVKARAKLMKGHVGMASMLLHLDLKEVDASECSTMATDGKNI